MSESYDEPADVWDERHPRCRKARKCEACREEIRVGDVYSRTSVFYDGEWELYIRCLRCDTMYHFLSKKLLYGGDEQPAPRLDCGHEYTEVWGGPPPPEILELAFMTPGEAQAKFGGEKRGR